MLWRGDQSFMTTGMGHTVAGPFQLGTKPWEWVWLRGSGKALKLGLGHPQTCSTHSLLISLTHWATPSFQWLGPEACSHLGLHLQNVSSDACHPPWDELPSQLLWSRCCSALLSATSATFQLKSHLADPPLQILHDACLVRAGC